MATADFLDKLPKPQAQDSSDTRQDATVTSCLSVKKAVADLQVRAEAVNIEVSQVRAAFLAKCSGKPSRMPPGVSQFAADLKSERRALTMTLHDCNALLERLGTLTASPLPVPETSPENGLEEALGRLRERMTAANLPSLETRWAVIKRCKGLAFIDQMVSRGPPTTADSRLEESSVEPRAHLVCGRGRADEAERVLVHAAVDYGGVWIRVFGVGEKRLLYEMARSGWDWDGEEGDGMEEGEEEVMGSEKVTSDRQINSSTAVIDGDSDDEDEIPAIRCARRLIQAARVNKYKWRCPQIRLIFSKVEEGKNNDIDKLLERLRQYGGEDTKVTVECANSPFLRSPVPGLETAMANLILDEVEDLTPVLNLDITILISLVSDITNLRGKYQTHHREDVRSQMDEESKYGSSLERCLYPALRDRRLVCTRKAAWRFGIILCTIGTETERARGKLLLQSGQDAAEQEKKQAQLVEEFQKLTSNKVPPELRLPVEVVDDLEDDAEELVKRGELPRAALAVAPLLSGLNEQIFLYGWAKGLTTVTANGQIAKGVTLALERHGGLDEKRAPSIWRFPFVRALAATPRPNNEPVYS